MKVEEVMKKKVEFIEADAQLIDAIEIMVDKGIRSLLVKPSSEKDDYGVISTTDVVLRALGLGLDPLKTKVKEIMTKPIIWLKKEVDITEVANLMREHNVARVFVKEDRQVIGVIALLDITVALLRRKVIGPYVA
jgi:CBS domain-containing protein